MFKYIIYKEITYAFGEGVVVVVISLKTLAVGGYLGSVFVWGAFWTVVLGFYTRRTF